MMKREPDTWAAPIGGSGRAGGTRWTALVLLLLAAALLRGGLVGYGRDSLSIQIDEDRNVSLPLNLSLLDLEPHDPGYVTRFDYPALLWYALFALDTAVFRIGHGLHFLKDWAGLRPLYEKNPIPFFLLGRSLSVVFGTAGVGGLYLLGRRLFSPAHGLLAAAFLAGAFLHVRDSALATVDAPATFFVVLALLGAAAILREGRLRDYGFAGVAAGLATATKYNAVLVLIALVTAHGLRPAARGSPWRRALGPSRLWGSLLWAAIVFLTVNPYLVLDWRSARLDLGWLAERVRTGQVMGSPVDVGPAWWYHLAVSLRYGLGLGLLGLALVGILRTIRHRDTAGWVVLSFLVGFYLVMGSARLAFARYMTPVLPVLCLFAAVGLLAVTARLPWVRARPWVVAGLAALAVLEPLNAVRGYHRLVHHTDTRVEAFKFLSTGLPPGNEGIATYGPDVVWRSTIPPGGRWMPTVYAKHPQQTWGDVLGILKGRGDRYVLVHTSGLDVYSPPFPQLEASLRQSATLVREFSPNQEGARPRPVYDRADPYYFPVGRFEGLARPGPTIRVYHLD